MKQYSQRFENAVSKLYTAFHNGTLNAMDCRACACGNICNNNPRWTGSEIGAALPDVVLKSGYSEYELSRIESIFMFGEYKGYPFWDAEFIVQPTNNDKVFTALCAVIEYLCELEGIQNIMDYTSLFETEEDKPKYKLEEVFVN